MIVRTFGEKFKILRSKRGYTQKELAKMLGYTQRRISDLEGLAFAPKEITVIHIAQVFGIKPKVFLSDYQGELS